MAIADHLIPQLRDRFPGRGLKVTGGKQPCAIFPAIHPAVGDIEIHDDDFEITIEAGTFTHGHFSNYDDQLTEAQRATAIIADVLEFLESVFADRVVFWGSHENGGGWYRRDRSDGIGNQSVWPAGSDGTRGPRMEYVWSGPIESSRPTGSVLRRLFGRLSGRRK